MAPSKRKAPFTPSARPLKRAQLRLVASDQQSLQEPIKLSLATKARKDPPPEEQQQKPFRLMDLAPELRILVYEKVLENHPVAKLARNSKLRELSSTSVLPRVSKQVRSEFLNVLTTSVPIVETVVTNFCFGHIVTFLNRLSDIDLERMTSTNASRILRITLEFSASCNVPQLHRWLNRAEHPTKKGSKIDFQYVSHQSWNAYHAIHVSHIEKGEGVKIRRALRQS